MFVRTLKIFAFSILLGSCLSYALPLRAEETPWGKKFLAKRILEKKSEKAANPKGSKKGLYIKGQGKSYTQNINGREFIVYIPQKTPPAGQRTALIALHGGFGHAAHLQNYAGLDAVADHYGALVVYIDGTKVAGALPDKFKGWNAGGCCGQPETKKIDDIGLITSVIENLKTQYGVDPRRIYGTGHSNGAMMTQRIMCETNLYQSAVTYAGTLQMDLKSCPNAQGKIITNIHGSEDENLPVNGGHTKKGINKKTNYKSQANTKSVFEASGAQYNLILLQGADHSPETINEKLWETQNIPLPQAIFSYLGFR